MNYTCQFLGIIVSANMAQFRVIDRALLRNSMELNPEPTI
ncbi:hypothetical protein VCRA2128O310_150127 [Vibrio crassostreae]|nr:hypothetical protein VCRA2113O196_210005 [Vibrio crassostreae]CAK1895210.1 hypothetical protein VCRA2117O378_220002 [Vibrio crassostreae]CAK1911466.1 hypothetical protein VCRA2113O356_220106 [Vibrio crassostreae]CAK2321718.1 hypothetical protein VCRA2119O386_230106 [Vibrio crassostreae]CAK2683603.1 hypothetical protein VCRA2117O375_200105 [Vibrio crassostreae]